MRITSAGLILIFVGVAIFAWTLIRLIGGAALDPQTKVPGTVRANIDGAGRYYLWDNHWTTFEGERFKYAADCPDDVSVTAKDANNAKLDFVRDSSQNWSIGNHSKTSIGYLDVPAATTIQIDIENAGRERIVTVSNRTMKQELWSRLGGFGIGIVVSAVGLVVCLLGFALRPRKPIAEISPAADVGSG